MASLSLCLLWAALAVCVLCLPKTSLTTESGSVPNCAECMTCTSEKKNVTLHVINALKPPYMAMGLQVSNTCQKYLLGVMQEAATINSSFRFSATYYDQTLGFNLDAYNFVYGNYSLDKSYWWILDGDMKPLQLGISNYQPYNGETVTFNLTRST